VVIDVADAYGRDRRIEFVVTGEISIVGSRIIAVCDAFDAMTSDRSYRQAISVDAALEQLNQHAGTQFDARIVEAFCKQMSPRPAPGF
jgi:HD-GYP domain-containing protein (c-di-GMP phosphodiesterase class II)